MNFLKISNNSISEAISVPTSKSYTNRALILAALDPMECVIENISWSQDVLDMLDVFRKIGLMVEVQDNTVSIQNSFPTCETEMEVELELDLGEGGTTSRFLVAMLSLGKRTYVLNAQRRMQKRPMHTLYNNLSQLGVSITTLSENSFPVRLKGPIHSTVDREVEIDCFETTQFYSALLLLTHKLPIKFRPQRLVGSKGYVEITQKVLKTFKYRYTVPVDFSGASYPIAFGALNQKVNLMNCLERDDLQGDSVLLDVITKSGAGYFFDNTGLNIIPAKDLNGFELDCIDCPDLVPTLCFLASYAKGISKLRRIANLRLKESDRIEGVLNLMRQFNVECDYNTDLDELVICGRKKDSIYRSITVEHDHRMVMSATLFLKHNGGGEVSSQEAVKKSFPTFFEIF